MQRRGQRRVVGPQELLAYSQRPTQRDLGIGIERTLALEVTQALEARGGLEALGAKGQPSNAKRVLQERRRFLVEAHAAVDAPQRVEERGLSFRLLLQLHPRVLHCAVEELPGGDGVGISGVGGTEEALQESRGASRRCSLALGEIAFLGERGGQLGPVRCEPDDEDREGRGHGQPRAVSSYELAGEVGPRGRAGADGLVLEVATQVLGELDRARVAPRGDLAHGLEDDVVQVTAELVAQASWVGTACSGDLLGGRRPEGVFLSPRSIDRFRHDGAGPPGLDVGDQAGDVVERLLLETERTAPRQKLVQHDTQRVHVGGRRYRRSLDLFGARVLGSHRAQARTRQRRAAGEQIRSQQPGDPEVEQLWLSGRRDQDVAGLDVAVDDQALVRDGGRPGTRVGTAPGARRW